MRRPVALALALFAGSILLSAIFWLAGIPFFVAFLFIPFIPFLSRDRQVKRCPACGWETTGGEHFCPYDATPLRDVGREEREGEN